ncbi:MAG: DUF2752 domain-containing protein [Prevotella sp.]|nr:DUF2752 domain-containing protein [Prevotella sp.]
MRRFCIIIIILAVVALSLYFLNPCSYWFMPKCPFKLITGLSCPGCGIQRFIYALLHGYWHEAIAYNYYLAYSLPYASLFVIAWIMPQGNAKERLSNIIENKFLVWFYIITFFLWLIIRNILKI